jgi:predicted O-linked N-acetylglucosamine transferase (SPINDLY family)
MLMTAGLELLVAQTPEQYLDIAVGLYHDRQRLSSLRAQLREARESSALFDMAAFTRNLESIYMRMWQDHRSGRRVQILADQESHPQQLATDIGA